MQAELRRRAHGLFVRALDVPATERASFVEAQCDGDAALLSRVNRLLEAVDRSTGFLETPALADRPALASPGQPPTIRGYRVVRVLGAGGMATIYEAVQQTPERRVAIKVMLRALANTSAVDRFKYETEVLARLEHPGIARIYEAGTCDDGSGQALPYFAMELVDNAETITAYADGEGLDLGRRLALFIDVCDAVQHGHQMGVVHRDLKPSNILVDGSGRVRVIDFGVARCTDTGPEGLTERAEAGRLIGTLHAMSPEQCVSTADVDVRADVYALGVLLYRLVTGRMPHDLSSCSVPQAVRVICEEAPARPSSIAPAARGDLDAIIGKAMDKDRRRRYAGAGSLAADVRRHLAHEPIEARPASALEQAVKFARRNPPFAAAAAAAVLLLVAGAAVSLSFAWSFRRARDASEQRTRELERVLEFQEGQLAGLDMRSVGGVIRRAVSEDLRRGRAAGAGAPAGPDDASIDRLMDGVNFTNIAVRTVDEAVLSPMTGAIDRQFGDQPLVRARLLHRLAATVSGLGIFARAEAMLVEAVRLRRESLGPDHADTLQSLHGLGAVQSSLGRYAEAEASLRAALEGLERTVGPEHEQALRVGVTLGGVLRNAGKHQEAARVWGRTLELQRRVLGEDHPATLKSLNNMGVAYAVQGRMADAEACWRELMERRRRIDGGDSDASMTVALNLALLLLDESRFEEARSIFERGLDFYRRRSGDLHPDALLARAYLASLEAESGNVGAAEAHYRACLDGRRRTFGPEHPSTLLTQAALGGLLMQRGDPSEGERMLTEALAVQERALGRDHPQTLESVQLLGRGLNATGKADRALAVSRDLLDRCERSMAAGDPTAASARAVHGANLLASGDLAAAERFLLEAHAALLSAVGPRHQQTRFAAARLADVYEARAAGEPGAGHERTAAEWRARADAVGGTPRRGGP